MTSPLSIPEARAVIEAATPGPWRALLNSHGMTGVHSDGTGSNVKIYHVTLADEAHPDTHARQRADATCIAAARTGWPAALDEIDRLRAELRTCERQVDGERVINGENGTLITRLRAAWRTMQEGHYAGVIGDADGIGEIDACPSYDDSGCPCTCGLSERQAKERKVLEGK